MKLYMHPFSQHSRRVLMLCHELNIAIEQQAVALESGEHKSEAFLSLNPAGQVPVLVDGDTTLAESHAIMKYLVDKSRGSTLYPESRDARAMVDMWLDWNHTKLNPPVQRIAIQMLRMGENADKQVIATSHEQVGDALTGLSKALRGGTSIGRGLSLADLSVASTVALYEMVGGEVKDAAVADWYGSVKTRPSFSSTAPQAG